MFSTLSGIFQNFCLQHILQPQSPVTWWVGGGLKLFFFLNIDSLLPPSGLQPPTWAWRGAVCSTEIQVVAPLCLDTKLKIISECTFHCSWYYLYLIPWWQRQMKGKHVLITFAFLLWRSLQKSWSQVQLPWSAGGLTDKQNCEIDFCTQNCSSRSAIFFFF